jgi:hypothetical protein
VSRWKSPWQPFSLSAIHFIAPRTRGPHATGRAWDLITAIDLGPPDARFCVWRPFPCQKPSVENFLFVTEERLPPPNSVLLLYHVPGGQVKHNPHRMKFQPFHAGDLTHRTPSRPRVPTCSREIRTRSSILSVRRVLLLFWDAGQLSRLPHGLWNSRKRQSRPGNPHRGWFPRREAGPLRSILATQQRPLRHRSGSGRPAVSVRTYRQASRYRRRKRLRPTQRSADSA